MPDDFPVIEPMHVQDVSVDGVLEAVELPDGRVHVTLFSWGVQDGRPAKVVACKFVRPCGPFLVREMIAAKKTFWNGLVHH